MEQRAGEILELIKALPTTTDTSGWSEQCICDVYSHDYWTQPVFQNMHERPPETHPSNDPVRGIVKLYCRLRQGYHDPDITNIMSPLIQCCMRTARDDVVFVPKGFFLHSICMRNPKEILYTPPEELGLFAWLAPLVETLVSMHNLMEDVLKAIQTDTAAAAKKATGLRTL